MDGDAERTCKTFRSCQVVEDFRAPEPMQLQLNLSIWALTRRSD